ncbi:TetR/AcrR family transcriptional regulator [Actinoplanes solisilvae]|uniref:TetR/AcrR family transcriptional regulator n=1 Tax=Actinoplanes solisilvae TaxID=2486853 RepID=UPI000FDCB495|nr:TetR/AcrR family transcriptional regulator [Actinoplanes solisilvae]
MTRSYRSPVRAVAAQVTRAAIVEAARALFAQRGYARTSVAAIADRAGVALNTVYTSVGGKPALIAAVAQDATDDAAIEAALAETADTADGRRILRVLADGTAEVTRRQSETLRFLLENRSSEPAVAEAAEQAFDRYRERLTRAATRLAGLDALRPWIDAERAAQILWFYFGAAAWSTARQMGWTWDDAADWLYAQAVTALLDD